LACTGLLPQNGCSFGVDDYACLALLLHRAAELALSLPEQAAVIFVEKVKPELAAITSFDTEVERIVRQRVGQDTLRQALLDYWGGSCAVTGINLPEVLRASHAKPWAECCTDEERLIVFNGFLLVANLDALIDRGLISFVKSGEVICSTRLETSQRSILQLTDNLKLRWIAPAHQPFLSWHRNKLFQR
jgi:putative restriction endonuclease